MIPFLQPGLFLQKLNASTSNTGITTKSLMSDASSFFNY